MPWMTTTAHSHTYHAVKTPGHARCGSTLFLADTRPAVPERRRIPVGSNVCSFCDTRSHHTHS